MYRQELIYKSKRGVEYKIQIESISNDVNFFEKAIAAEMKRKQFCSKGIVEKTPIWKA